MEEKTAQLSLTKIPKQTFLMHWETLMTHYHILLENLALLGTHTLGRVRMETSGFEGRWVRNTSANGVNAASVLDNKY